MQRSALWQSIHILRLIQNMQLNTADEHECEFAQWQLDIGHGRHMDENGNLILPDHFHCRENILASRNDDIDSINMDILRQFPGEILTFLSADTIKNNNGEVGQDVLMYPVEYLNSINCSGLPLHKLELKKGCPIMVWRSL